MSENGQVKNFSKDKGFEVIPRDLLQNENLSLQAIGFLCNLQSYPETWKIYKTELYKRYKKNGRRSVTSIWNELIEEGYIIELRRRNGKKYDYIYYFNLTPFTEDEATQIIDQEQAEVLGCRFSAPQQEPHDDGEFWDVHFEHSNLNSSKCTPNKIHTKEITQENIDTKIDTYKETEKADFSSKQIEIEKERDQIYKESLDRDIPPVTFHNLSVLSENYEEMYKWIGIVLRAKKKVEEERNESLLLEHIDHELNRILIAGIRKIKKDTTIKNKDNYLFMTVYNGLEQMVVESYRQNAVGQAPYHNWLEA